MDFTAMSNDDLAAALTEKRQQASTIFALTEPTIEQVDEAEALVASIGEIEAEQAKRAQAVKDAADRFAAARATFSAEDAEPEADSEEDGEEDDESDDTAEIEAAVEDSDDTDQADEAETDEGETVTAAVNHTTSQTIKAGLAKPAARTSAASKVGSRAKRPAVKAAPPVTITAAADVPNVPAGAPLADLEAVARAVQSRVKGFAPFNKRAAEMARSASGGAPVLNKFGVASFGVDFAPEQVATAGNDYAAVKFAQDRHKEVITASMNGTEAPGGGGVLTAAGWCAPSENVYTWLADYVVDGLVTIPEVSAPRGGLNITTGPALAQDVYGGDNVDNFGFGGTEAEAIAGYTKTCETIVCPEFEDHRLDFVGYCWKIPFLTQAAYPELITDALRLSNVLYAHKLNRRFIGDLVAESTAVDATNKGFGSSQFDTLEALTIVAVKERRWWNLGENAMMEVKVPQWAREVFIFDMAKRSGLALSDMANEAKVNAHFAAHNLSVEYVSDYQDIHGSATPTVDWPNTMKALIYPVGTFVKAVEDVVNLSAVYDAASLTANEYTGVFFEQGVMTVKMGYRSHEVTVPVCTAGATGANIFECGPATSF